MFVKHMAEMIVYQYLLFFFAHIEESLKFSLIFPIGLFRKRALSGKITVKGRSVWKGRLHLNSRVTFTL